MRNHSLLALIRSDFSNSEGTQLVDGFPLFFFAIVSLCATRFTGIRRKLRLGAAEKLKSARGMQQWWRRKNKELVNSKKLQSPPYKDS
jgi:hypothetical protein